MVSFFLLLAPVIIIEQTACATSIRSLTEIKQRGDNGMDYFGITAGGENGVWFSGMDKEHKLQRNHNKCHSLVSKQNNYCLIWTRWWNCTDSHALAAEARVLVPKKCKVWKLFANICKCSARTQCWHTFRKASYSHQEHSSALKPKAYITLSASQRVKLSEKRPETLSYETVRTTVLLATKKKITSCTADIVGPESSNCSDTFKPQLQQSSSFFML